MLRCVRNKPVKRQAPPRTEPLSRREKKILCERGEGISWSLRSPDVGHAAKQRQQVGQDPVLDRGPARGDRRLPQAQGAVSLARRFALRVAAGVGVGLGGLWLLGLGAPADPPPVWRAAAAGIERAELMSAGRPVHAFRITLGPAQLRLIAAGAPGIEVSGIVTRYSHIGIPRFETSGCVGSGLN